MKLKINIIDAFSDENFKGNSAAVILLDKWLDDELMLNIAKENNLSETAFVIKDHMNVFHIRWFSPLKEIDFCGHATLASSYVLFKDEKQGNLIKFFARAVGEFEVRNLSDGYIQMNFPNRNPKKVNEIPLELINGLSINPIEVYKNQQAYFAIYEKEEDIFNVSYEKEFLEKLAPLDIVVTSLSSQKEYDFISRYFWPANGGEEDPVTGSIHAGLAPFWAKKLEKNILTAFQASQRTGVLVCELRENRVLISGKAVEYLEGYINI